MEKYFKLLIQFIKFSIIGVSNTLISLAVYYALVYLGAHYLAANVVGYICGILNSYYWNNKYVFKRSGGHIRTLIKVFAGYIFSMLVGMGLLALQIEYLGISEYIAPLVNVPILTVINFTINKLWAFK